MHNEGASIVEPEEEILPTSSKRGESAPNEARAQRIDRGVRKQMDRCGIDLDTGNRPANNQRRQVSANGLNFGQLGHMTSVACAECTRQGATIPREFPGRHTAGVITHLSGHLARMDETGPSVEVDVSGVGYEVLLPIFLWPEVQALAGDSELGENGSRPEIGLHIHYSASANQPVPVLVGFLRRAERDFFRKFISVEGIGPAKAVKAMNISVSSIARAIEQEDRATLTRLPGIGARGADKIIAALRGKLVAEAALQDGGISKPVDRSGFEGRRVAVDAIETIAALGYPRSDARRWVEEALADNPALTTIEELTLAVLRGRDSRD